MKKREWLAKARCAKGLNQDECSCQVGVSYSLYSKIEQGERRPSPEVAKKISNLLGIEWTKFFDAN